jgi:hypothetical protein
MNNTTLAMFEPNVFKSMLQYADMLVKSGFLPGHIKNAQQVIAIITYGQELGVGTWTALNGIQVIQGKPCVSPALMLALINRSGMLEDMRIEGDATYCAVSMKRTGRTAHVETFTFDDATKMGLTGKDNYKKQPGVMLKWRAVSACARVVFPDVLSGLYTTEEMSPDNTTVTEDGEVIYNAPQLTGGERPTFADNPDMWNKMLAFVRSEGLDDLELMDALNQPTMDAIYALPCDDSGRAEIKAAIARFKAFKANEAEAVQ